MNLQEAKAEYSILLKTENCTKLLDTISSKVISDNESNIKKIKTESDALRVTKKVIRAAFKEAANEGYAEMEMIRRELEKIEDKVDSLSQGLEDEDEFMMFVFEQTVELYISSIFSAFKTKCIEHKIDMAFFHSEEWQVKTKRAMKREIKNVLEGSGYEVALSSPEYIMKLVHCVAKEDA